MAAVSPAVIYGGAPDPAQVAADEVISIAFAFYIFFNASASGPC